MPGPKKTASAPVSGNRTLTDKSYRLCNDMAPVTYTLKVGRAGDLLVFDENAGYNRAIRYCPNEKSIFVDEQSEHALVEPIIIERGHINVPGKQVQLQNFLDAHPDNVANGGNIFELIDEAGDAQTEIEHDDMVTLVKAAIAKKAKEKEGVLELEMVLAAITGSSEIIGKALHVNILKRDLYAHVDRDPRKFTDASGENVTIFEDENIRRKYIVLRSISDNIIRLADNKRTFVWAEDKAEITTTPTGVNAINYFADFLATEEGALVLDQIKKRS